MTEELDSKLEKMKEYGADKDISRLNKRIYDLKLDKNYLKNLSMEKLQYIHVKLHNALSYKKPFADMKSIKKIHDIVAKLLDKHLIIDKLDEIK